MFTESQLLPISALQHLAFCPRQWGLIHLEQVWQENRLTAQGRLLHDKTHTAESESRPDIRIARGLRIHSLRLGLSGQADVVEFHMTDKGIELTASPGLWQPFPVEYKRGKPKRDNCDTIQLCAQAICLEEMLQVEINAGALFYGRPRRRYEVIFNDNLRAETEEMTRRLHVLQDEGKTPVARYQKKCDSCSLYEVCLPKTTGVNKDVVGYIKKSLIQTQTAEN